MYNQNDPLQRTAAANNSQNSQFLSRPFYRDYTVSLQKEVPPRFELGLLDSKSNVLTSTPWDQLAVEAICRYKFKGQRTKTVLVVY